MSQTHSFLLDRQGTTRDLGAFVVAVRFTRDGGIAGFGLGDGSVWTLPDEGTWTQHPVHDGAILSMAVDPAGQGFVTGGDDGQVRRLHVDGSTSSLSSFGMKWVEHVAGCGLDKKKGLIAASAGKIIRLFDETGRLMKELAHPSTVTGVVFDGKGKRIGASHYNGATLWFVAAKTDTPRRLEWKGSHIGIIIHPEGEAVVTTMQENALHGWKLPDGQHMRMSGYPSKTLSVDFTRTGKWLASSGADTMVLWPFFGGGPMGKAPVELAGGDGILCNQVACHPRDDLVAGGFADGLVVVADINSSRITPVVPPGHGPISALAFSADGKRLGFGTETGFAGVVNVIPR